MKTISREAEKGHLGVLGAMAVISAAYCQLPTANFLDFCFLLYRRP